MSFVENMFMTPQKKKQAMDAYYKKMFPLGKQQQEWENNIADELFADDKKNISTYKYFILIRREMYIDNVIDKNENILMKQYNKQLKRMRVNEDAAKIIDALCRLENKCKYIEDFPTKEMILKEAENGY